jgi:acyl carrier protein
LGLRGPPLSNLRTHGNVCVKFPPPRSSCSGPRKRAEPLNINAAFRAFATVLDIGASWERDFWMTGDEAFAMIKNAAAAVNPNAADKISLASHLVDDGIFDSLDLMNFLFELETAIGHKIEQIDEDYSDFRVQALIAVLENI